MRNAIPPLTQLQAYADWESKNRPDPKGRLHIAQWAVMEIERLMQEIEALKERAGKSNSHNAETRARLELPAEAGAGVIAGCGNPFFVKLRRDWPVKPEAEQIDGNVYVFREGWVLDEEDTSVYVGETAMVSNDFDWPADAPAWIASGDLVPAEPLRVLA